MEIKKESNRNQTEPQEIKRGRGGARSGAGRPKRGPTLPVSQVEDHTADRAAYDSKLAGGVPSRTDDPRGGGVAQAVEPESVSRPSPVPAQPSHPSPEPSRGHVQDCALVPRPHDATGGCC